MLKFKTQMICVLLAGVMLMTGFGTPVMQPLASQPVQGAVEVATATIPYTPFAPAVDGIEDAVWASAVTLPRRMLYGYTDAPDFGVMAKVLHDDANVYVLVNVADETKRNDGGADWWNDDSIEIYIDGNNSRGATYDGVDDRQLSFRYNDATMRVGGLVVTGIEWRMVDIGNGYRLEAKLPKAALSITGAQFGLDVQVNDDDWGDRQSKWAWAGVDDNSYVNAGLFGVGVLQPAPPSAWQQMAKITAPTEAVNGLFGKSVAMSGDVLVVGAPKAKGLGSVAETGAAYVYQRNGATWDFQTKLIAPDAENGDEFGYSVAIDGNRIIVGSPGKVIQGAVFTWTNTTTSTMTANFADNEIKVGGGYGGVSILPGQTFSATGTAQGAIYSFFKNQTAWSYEKRLTYLKAEAGTLVFGHGNGLIPPGWTYSWVNRFGANLGVSGTSVVGTGFFDRNGCCQGIIQFYGGGAESQFGKLYRLGNVFHSHVAPSYSRLIRFIGFRNEYLSYIEFEVSRTSERCITTISKLNQRGESFPFVSINPPFYYCLYNHPLSISPSIYGQKYAMPTQSANISSGSNAIVIVGDQYSLPYNNQLFHQILPSVYLAKLEGVWQVVNLEDSSWSFAGSMNTLDDQSNSVLDGIFDQSGAYIAGGSISQNAVYIFTNQPSAPNTPTPSTCGASASANQLTNPNFTSDMSGWNRWDNNSSAVNGKLQIVGVGGIGQHKAASAGQSYSLKASSGSSGNASLGLNFYDAGWNLLSRASAEAGGANATRTAQATAPANTALVEAWVWNSSGTLSADDFCLTGGGGGNPTVTPTPTPLITPSSTSTPAPASCTNNALANGGFENDFANWQRWDTASSIGSDAKAGSKALRIGPGAGGIGQHLAVTPGANISLSAWSKLANGGSGGRIGLTFFNAQWQQVGSNVYAEVGSTSYTRHDLSATVPAGASIAQVWAYKSGTSGEQWLDEVCLQGAATAASTGAVARMVAPGRWVADAASASRAIYLPLTLRK